MPVSGPKSSDSSPGGDPHDLDGAADHVGGALFAFRSGGHAAINEFFEDFFWGLRNVNGAVFDAGKKPYARSIQTETYRVFGTDSKWRHGLFYWLDANFLKFRRTTCLIPSLSRRLRKFLPRIWRPCVTTSQTRARAGFGYDKQGLSLSVGARRIFRRIADWGDEPYKEMNSLTRKLVRDTQGGRALSGEKPRRCRRANWTRQVPAPARLLSKC